MAIEIGSSWTKLVEYSSTDTYTVTYRLYAKYSATSIVSNTHTIQLKWTTQKTSGGTGVYDNDSTTPKVTNISNGSPSSWTGSSFTIPAGSAVAETDRTTSGDITVTHNTNGTYSATWSWSLSHVYEGGGKSGTVAVTLPTIPRASTFALSSNSILSNGSTTATITEYDASFNHKITAVYNSTTYYFLGSSSATSSALSASLSVPAALRTAMASANAKSISLTLTLSTYSGSTVIGTSTNSLTITVPTATVSMSANSVNCNANITWTLANTDTTACTYTVTRKYSSITYTDQTKATTTSKAVANANFQTVMASATSGTVTTTVTTYVGTTSVGTATATYTVNVPTATYYWSVANGTTTYQGGKQSGKSIAGLEHVTQTFTCASNGTSNSSTVANYNVTCSRSDISLTVTKSSNTITVVTGTLPGSASNYNFTLTCTIADTRGTTKSVTTGNITATGYQLPKVSGSATRVNSSGTADSTGTYAKLTATAIATTATMSSVVIKYGSSTAASGTSSATNNAYGGSFAVTSSYSFTVTATDSFGQTTTLTLQLPVASYEFNLYPGGGAAFGKVAVANRVESAYNWAFIYTSDSTSGGLRVKNNTYDIGLTQGDPTYGNRGLYDYNASTYFVYRNADNNTVLNSNNDIVINSTTYAKGQMVANNGAQTVGFFFKPTNTHADSEVQNPGRIYYQTSIAGYEGRFMFREYSPTSADPTKYVAHYEYFGLPAPDKDRTTDKVYYILTDKNLVTEAQGGTGQSSLDDVTVGTAKAGTVTAVSPTAGTNYYLMFGTGTSGNRAFGVYAGGIYRMLNGSTSTEGYMGVVLGRGIASGSANNGYGFLRIYGHGTYYYNIYPNQTANTANVTLYAPNQTGTIAIRDATVTGTLTNGSWVTIAYPTGYSQTTCHVTGWDVDYNGNYRTGDGLENSATTSRVLISLESDGIKVYTASSTYNSKTIRVFLSLNA